MPYFQHEHEHHFMEQTLEKSIIVDVNNSAEIIEQKKKSPATL